MLVGGMKRVAVLLMFFAACGYAELLRSDRALALSACEQKFRGCKTCKTDLSACTQCKPNQATSATAAYKSYALKDGRCVMTVNRPWYFAPAAMPVINLLAGDKVKFIWADFNPHNVWKVPSATCDLSATGAKQLYPSAAGSTATASGTTVPKFNTGPLAAGTYYYACGVGSGYHCSSGLMKVKVVVAALPA
eukprot:TRINITY_DN4520_c0_g1_i1.p1 TRINITY_DN4520_c0_g1~~TRINITY_DN4520_c0_g1_i1.p1  ORF type:complete len:213 (-),score=38.54 TRINITY_DN4520_c0_g1_i1:238-813(-)